MDYTFSSKSTASNVVAISSKSEAHRALICAAFSKGNTDIICNNSSDDINATVNCLARIGTKIARTQNGFSVIPTNDFKKNIEIDCGESGSTLRFLLPAVSALGIECDIYMHGRLPHRPLSPLYELLANHGVSLSKQGTNPLHVKGKFDAGDYEIAGDVSSQFISGLLFALCILGKRSNVSITGNLESEPYVNITVQTLRQFGADIKRSGNTFQIYPSTLTSPKTFTVGGDWSNSAFFLCAGAIGGKAVCVHGLNLSSEQGDKEIMNILRCMGANVTTNDGCVVASKGILHGIKIDASQIPDLVPVLATVASVAQGETVIYNASRLRLKESNRIASVCKSLSDIGANIKETDDGLIIKGKKNLIGGTTDACGDHRIAMSMAVASLVCDNPVTVCGIEAINKSYPNFLSDFVV